MCFCSRLFLMVIILSASFFKVDARTTAHAYAETGFYKEIDEYRSYLSSISGGVVYMRKGFELGGELNIYKFWNSDYSSVGVGIRPVARYSLIRFGKGISLLTEVKGGVIYMTPEHPANAVNYTFNAGFAMEVPVKNKNKMRVGFHYSHFSNGKRMGDIENPTWDGLGLYINWLF